MPSRTAPFSAGRQTAAWKKQSLAGTAVGRAGTVTRTGYLCGSTFSYAAGATDALLWITATRPAGARAYAGVVIGLITALIAAIAARTVVAIVRGQFLPPVDQRP
jgi:hypothetical protein